MWEGGEGGMRRERERVKKQKQRGEKEEERMRRGADRGSIYYVIMSHPYPKLHKSPSNCCVSEIFFPQGGWATPSGTAILG